MAVTEGGGRPLAPDEAVREGRPVQAAKARARKLEVLEATVGVIVERGLDRTRYADVVEASGVPVGSLQYYFHSLDDLLQSCFRHGAASDRENLEALMDSRETSWEKVTVVIESQLEAFSTPPGSRHVHVEPASYFYVEFFATAMLNPGYRADVRKFTRESMELLGGIIRVGQAKGEFKSVADPEHLSLTLISMMQGVVLPLSLHDPDYDIDDIRRLSYEFTAELLGADPALGPALPAAAEPAH